MSRDSTKFKIEIRIAAPNKPNPYPAQAFTVTGAGGSVRVALARAAGKLAPTMRHNSSGIPLTVEIRKVS